MYKKDKGYDSDDIRNVLAIIPIPTTALDVV